MPDIVKITDLRKAYADGFEALKGVSLNIREGEILALLGPNGAGKTTLISTICGITTGTGGSVTVGGFDTVNDYRGARSMIGLVPQEINLEPFEKVAKALAHEPRVLFLDEPTAGVDVELRRDMWNIVADLKASGVTIILTTHYIEEAEAIADRIGVIAHGELLLVEDKDTLMSRMGKKQLVVQLTQPIDAIPDSLVSDALTLSDDGHALIYSYDTRAERTGITKLLSDVAAAGLVLSDLETSQSSLEDIFVDLVKEDAA